jgi:hypothetical protein
MAAAMATGGGMRTGCARSMDGRFPRQVFPHPVGTISGGTNRDQPPRDEVFVAFAARSISTSFSDVCAAANEPPIP